MNEDSNKWSKLTARIKEFFDEEIEIRRETYYSPNQDKYNQMLILYFWLRCRYDFQITMADLMSFMDIKDVFAIREEYVDAARNKCFRKLFGLGEDEQERNTEPIE
jgi:hypothetical protein